MSYIVSGLIVGMLLAKAASNMFPGRYGFGTMLLVIVFWPVFLIVIAIRR